MKDLIRKKFLEFVAFGETSYTDKEMKKVKHYTKKELDKVALTMIKEGKDFTIEHKGMKYTVDIKEYEKQLRFQRPELFKDEKRK